MTNTLTNLKNLYSPLDQFGSDVLNYKIFNQLYFSFAREIDVLYLRDLLSSELCQFYLILLFVFSLHQSSTGSIQWEAFGMLFVYIQSVIFVSNIVGMVPGVETITSDLTITFFYSFFVMTFVILLGFVLHSTRYLELLLPQGTPLIMTPFIIVIEFISYLARCISLGMRLFANMFAGHSLVKILMSFTWLFLLSPFWFVSLVVFALLVIIFMMESGIAYLQAYVFATLSRMYFEDMFSLDH